MKYCDTKKLGFYIIAPDDIDAIETTLPQGEIRKAIMEINHLRARIKSLKGENESISETCDAYITEATELQDRIDELEKEQVAWRKFTNEADATMDKLEAENEALHSLINKIYGDHCNLETASIIAANYIPPKEPEDD